MKLIATLESGPRIIASSAETKCRGGAGLGPGAATFRHIANTQSCAAGQDWGGPVPPHHAGAPGLQISAGAGPHRLPVNLVPSLAQRGHGLLFPISFLLYHLVRFLHPMMNTVAREQREKRSGTRRKRRDPLRTAFMQGRKLVFLC
jgi:hypothetical protein